MPLWLRVEEVFLTKIKNTNQKENDMLTLNYKTNPLTITLATDKQRNSQM